MRDTNLAQRRMPVKAPVEWKLVPRTAVLARRQPVAVEDVSRTGCRLTGPEALDVGQVGVLAVDVEGEIRIELFRVSRTTTLAGEVPLHQAGLEFLPMPAGAPSLHDLAAQLDDSHA